MTVRQKRIAGAVLAAILLVGLVAGLVWRVGAVSAAGSAGFTYFGVPTEEQKRMQDAGVGLFVQPTRSVMAVIPGGPAARAGIAPGDLVRSINGVDVAELKAVEALEKSAKAGDVLRYQLEREGKPIAASIRLESSLNTPAVLIGMISSLLLGFAYLTIGTLVYLIKPDSRLTFIFSATCLVGAMMFFVGSFQDIEGMARGILPASGFNQSAIIVFFLYLTLAIITASLLLHLSLIFPRERPIGKRYPGIITAIYILPFTPLLALLGMFAIIAILRVADLRSVTPVASGIVIAAGLGYGVHRVLKSRKAHPGDNLFLRNLSVLTLCFLAVLAGVLGLALSLLPRETAMVLFMVYGGSMMLWIMGAGVVYALLTCGSLIMSYRESSVDQKRQVRWPLWGTALTLGVTAVISVAYIVLMNAWPFIIARYPAISLAISFSVKLLFLLIPVSFAFGILKYRLMDIDVIIKKTLIYGIVTGIVVIIYLGLVGGLGTILVQYAGVQNQTMTVISTLTIAALFIPVRNRVQTIVDRKFFRRRYDYPATLQQIDERVPRMSELSEQLQFAAERLQQAVQTRSVAIFLKEPGEPFAPVASVGLRDERVERTKLNIAPQQLQAADVATIADLDTDEDEQEKLRSLGAARIVRIHSKGEPIGLITLGPKLNREEFDEEDHAFFVDVASRAAEAIDVQRDRKQAAESRQAADIQQALLPSVIPQLEGFSIAGMSLPARAVGGDYYDVLSLDDKSVVVCIADVCGKGMTAALMMSGLQSAVRSLAEPGSSPAETVTRIRRVVCSNLSGGKFITFFYGILDGATGTFRYTNAGHNAPVLARADGSVVRLKEGGGILGRLLMNTPLSEGEVTLSAGDRLVLFTDGVSEARNLEEDELGEDRVAELIVKSRAEDAEALRIEILEAVREFSGGNLHDDVTLAVVVAH